MVELNFFRTCDNPEKYADIIFIDAALAGRHGGHADQGKEREQVFLCTNGSNLQLDLVSI